MEMSDMKLRTSFNFHKIFPKAVSLVLAAFIFIPVCTRAQVKWTNADSAFGPLPAGFHLFKTNDSLDGKPFIAYYAEAKLKEPSLTFSTDTTFRRRLTPSQFYERNGKPLLVVNASFFSFETNQNLNVVIDSGRLLAYNVHSLPMRGKDTFQYRHPFGSAIGISKKRKADIAWLYTDSVHTYAFASQQPHAFTKDSVNGFSYDAIRSFKGENRFAKWKMRTAVGGGPVLVQEGKIQITNEQELKFYGKAINDKHPRTAMGYTADGRLIIMVIQGRFPGIAEGATLTQTAGLFVQLGCTEALNLDGGGSSCMLINGKETIKPSSEGKQRALPAVFLIN